jgi:hypothetical protein
MANPNACADPTALEGYHQFTSEEGEPYGSFEVFWLNSPELDSQKYARSQTDPDCGPQEPGWYWWACFPGCLPEGDPTGPFETSVAAYSDAQGEAADFNKSIEERAPEDENLWKPNFQNE